MDDKKLASLRFLTSRGRSRSPQLSSTDSEIEVSSPPDQSVDLFGGIIDIESLAAVSSFDHYATTFPPLAGGNNKFQDNEKKQSTASKSKFRNQLSVVMKKDRIKGNIPVAWPEMTGFTGLPEFGLKAKREHAERDQSIARLQLIKKGVDLVHQLPLSYLFSKPELRSYAIDRAARLLVKPALASINNLLKNSFRTWKFVPVKELDDRQVKLLVVAKCLSNLVEKRMRIKFRWWAFVCADRFKDDRLKYLDDAVRDIQRWWSHVKITHRKPWKTLVAAIQMCLHRRKAIRHIVSFENAREKSLNKIRKGIATRRRMFLAGRSIQRVFRWNLLRIMTSYRLIRVANARRIQRWRRMILHRHKNDLLLIREVLRLGGYTRVFSKVPMKHLQRGKLQSINSCSSMICKAYFASCGRMDLYMRFAARRAAAAHEEMLNEKASIIQNSWRAHLWDLLMLAATINNRSRRIQRGYRAYQYRHAMWVNLQRWKVRMATRLQRNFRIRMARANLAYRFKARKALLILTRGKRTISAMIIQRCYRAHVAWLLWVKEQLALFYAAQRANFETSKLAIQKIQQIFRKYHRPNWKVRKGGWNMETSFYSRHILILFKNEVRRKYYQLTCKAIKIQVVIRCWLAKRRILRKRWEIKNANKIWLFTKSYLLKLALFDRVMATRRRRVKAAKRILKNFRKLPFYRKVCLRVITNKLMTDLIAFRNLAVVLIQRLARRKHREYYMPLRKAARLQLLKIRAKRVNEFHFRVFDRASRICQKFGLNILNWNRIMKIITKERRKLLEWRKAKIIQHWTKAMLWVIRCYKYHRIRVERLQFDEQQRKYIWASNLIGHNWKRLRRQLPELYSRFLLRQKAIHIKEKLLSEKTNAEFERKLAEEDVQKTNDFLQETINASWRQGSDATGKNYYYNYVTGATQWEAPDDMKTKIVDTWVKNIDIRGNVYYYNMKTQESAWLPPCSVCGEEAERWCSDCQVAYCVKHFEPIHIGENIPDPTFADHIWSMCEYEKDILKPGDAYCIECKRKTCTRMCTTCWDGYCDPCFKLVHRLGALKSHQFVAYRRAKKGWICIKGRMAGEQDYYVNGTTGETTYDKPMDLMTEQEKIYYTNYLTHKAAAEEYTKKIEKLQIDLEAANYAKDMLILEQLQKKAKEKPKKDKVVSSNDVVKEVMKGGSGLMSMFRSATDIAYREKVLSGDDRKRGQQRSDYIKELLESAAEAKAQDEQH